MGVGRVERERGGDREMGVWYISDDSVKSK